MTGFEARLAFMRQAALAAAEALVRLSPDAPDDPRRPIPGLPAPPEAPLSDWLLAALASAERHPDAAAAFSILAEDERVLLPTPASFARIAAGALGADHDRALSFALGDNPFEAQGLIERVDPPGGLRPRAQQGLRLAAGQAALAFGVTPEAGETEPPPEVLAHPEEARAAARHLARHGRLWLRAPSRRLARQFALDIAGATGLGLALRRARPDAALGPPTVEGHLSALDLFEAGEAPPPRVPRLDGTPVLLLAPARAESFGLPALDAPPLGPEAARRVWEAAPLPEADRAALARRFRLTLPELRAALAEARMASDAPPDAAAVARAVRAMGARAMGPSVTRVESDVTLDDLVARPAVRGQLRDAVLWHRHSAEVWGTMGLARDAADARGLTLLFSGPPGGGKTFAARCLANALDLNLYRIDLSQVVSKYIGETEKALARVFDEAEAGHGVLFFDEADAVFGKRSEVRDAHDRYANIEVGYLLQRMESFDGVLILATNLRAHLDPAFLRRIRFAIDFPLPERPERLALWERNLPAAPWRAPGLDTQLLADRFRLSGGSIRNVAVAAAHLAAADGQPIGPGHLARALYRELEKAGLPRAPKDLGPLAEHLEAEA